MGVKPNYYDAAFEAKWTTLTGTTEEKVAAITQADLAAFPRGDSPDAPSRAAFVAVAGRVLLSSR